MTEPSILTESLDPPTRALVALAAAIATGQDALVAERVRRAMAADVPPVWVDELLLQSVLMTGWPRALNAAAVWRRESGRAAPATDGSLLEGPADWRPRGEATCATVYGPNYSRLRENVRILHPALDAWMVTDGYGRILSRPGLDLARRELCVIAQTAVQGADRQLHSHLRGALHAGASAALVEDTLAVVAEDLPAPLAEQAGRTWARVRRVG